MRLGSWWALVWLAWLLGYVHSLPPVIKIGAIFTEDQRDGSTELAFKYAVYKINRDKTILPFTSLEYDIRYVPKDDSFHASKKACSQVQLGVQAVFGPSDPLLGAHIHSICDALDIPHLEARLDLDTDVREFSINLHPAQHLLNAAFQDIMSFLNWTKVAIIYEEDYEKSETDTFFGVLKTKVISKFGKDNPSTITDTSPIERKLARLPRINLTSFSGKYEEWLSFRDSFHSLIDSNKSLTTIEKFQYLKGAVIGEAAAVIKCLETSETNYDQAKDLLKSRYENKRVIISNHIKALFELPVVTRESHDNFRNMLDSILQHTRALKAMGRPVEGYDDFLIYLITSKFPFSTRKEWEDKANVSQIFDPLGLVGPVTVMAKLLMQDIWKLRIGWDVELSQNLKHRWEEISSQLLTIGHKRNCEFWIRGTDKGILDNPLHSLPANTTCLYHLQGIDTSVSPSPIPFRPISRYPEGIWRPTRLLFPPPRYRVWLSVTKFHVAGSKDLQKQDQEMCRSSLKVWDGQVWTGTNCNDLFCSKDKLKNVPKTSMSGPLGLGKNVTLLARYCREHIARTCDHSMLANTTRFPRPCSLSESFLSSGDSLTLELQVSDSTALRPVQFRALYEFVDLHQDGEPYGIGACSRKFTTPLQNTQQKFQAPRDIFLYGRGGAKNLRYVFT
ncbi:uncharacterized protein LOC116180686 [Photinus pyralis]|uniref:uncharacterized protein LOC116180686 n=1 Tax=Photinus pyralis TaxID=7054 RepID=UPI0012677E78|nr:uncharacterized protein LOC116180686 [Photinus pyralis]